MVPPSPSSFFGWYSFHLPFWVMLHSRPPLGSAAFSLSLVDGAAFHSSSFGVVAPSSPSFGWVSPSRLGGGAFLPSLTRHVVLSTLYLNKYALKHMCGFHVTFGAYMC